MAETKTAQRRKAAQGIVKRRERRDTRPQEIVAAAFEEFAQHGYAGTRLEDVAARARVSKGLPYLYFKTKVELFKAVVKSVITPAFDAIRGQIEITTLPTEEFIKGPFLAFIQELVKSRRAVIARLLIGEGHKHPELTQFYFEHIVSRGLQTLQSLIDRGVARGEFRKTPLRDFPQLIIAPVLVSILWRGLFEPYRHLDTDRLPVPEQQEQREAGEEHEGGPLDRPGDDLCPPLLEPTPRHHAVLHGEDREQQQVDGDGESNWRSSLAVEAGRQAEAAHEGNRVEKGRQEHHIGTQPEHEERQSFGHGHSSFCLRRE